MMRKLEIKYPCKICDADDGTERRLISFPDLPNSLSNWDADTTASSDAPSVALTHYITNSLEAKAIVYMPSLELAPAVRI